MLNRKPLMFDCAEADAAERITLIDCNYCGRFGRNFYSGLLRT